MRGKQLVTSRLVIETHASFWSFSVTVRQSCEPRPLFQVLVNRLSHLEHVQFLTAKDWLQLLVGQDFSFVVWILKMVFLNVCPNFFGDFSSRQCLCADNSRQVL